MAPYVNRMLLNSQSALAIFPDWGILPNFIISWTATELLLMLENLPVPKASNITPWSYSEHHAPEIMLTQKMIILWLYQQLTKDLSHLWVPGSWHTTYHTVLVEWMRIMNKTGLTVSLIIYYNSVPPFHQLNNLKICFLNPSNSPIPFILYIDKFTCSHFQYKTWIHPFFSSLPHNIVQATYKSYLKNYNSLLTSLLASVLVYLKCLYNFQNSLNQINKSDNINQIINQINATTLPNRHQQLPNMLQMKANLLPPKVLYGRGLSVSPTSPSPILPDPKHFQVYQPSCSFPDSQRSPRLTQFSPLCMFKNITEKLFFWQEFDSSM